MTHPAYIREKAIKLRVDRKLTLDEIAERLALPKTTVYAWINHIPIPRTEKETAAQLERAREHSERARRRREEAYRAGAKEYPALAEEPGFREFVVLYIAEGFKRNRNTVSVCNSDPEVVAFVTPWIRRFSVNRVRFSFQYHADQDPEELRAFWGTLLGTDPTGIAAFKKKNSGQLRTRNWRCEYGVLAVRASDTMLRARLQAWIDLTKEGWSKLNRLGA